MQWSHAGVLLWALIALPLLWWLQRRSVHPMSTLRRRLLLAVRGACVLLGLAALAAPAWEIRTDEQAVIFLLDHSASQGEPGWEEGRRRAQTWLSALPSGTQAGFLSIGAEPLLLRAPSADRTVPELAPDQRAIGASDSDLAAAIALAQGLFPPGVSRRLVVLSDFVETRGSALEAARDAAVQHMVIDVSPLAGPVRPDVRILALQSSKPRLHEGATLDLTAVVESSLAGTGVIRLYENGVQVAEQPLTMEVGQTQQIVFQRTPEERRPYKYSVRVSGFAGDVLPENDESLTLVDVRGRPLLLYVEGEPDEAHYLVDAMETEGLRLHVRPPEAIPLSLAELDAYDGVILSDVPAYRLSDQHMALLRDYVEHLGGGLVMIGGGQSFGAGGYYRTPIEDVLPVKMQSPDKEEKYSVALMLVVDRSGSMDGPKLELCKSAAIATVELLSGKDFLGVVAFDSAPTWIVPLEPLTDPGGATARIAAISSGGGTHIYPGMGEGRTALASVDARVKHMIVLTDGQTEGQGYQLLAEQLREEGVTVSTVAVGTDADTGLLQSIATAGGGQYYATIDPASLPRIFTQDTMTHLGKLIREEAFEPQAVERHPMLAGWTPTSDRPLLGYVQTLRKSTAQVPLVTPYGDPLLAHWRFGLGKSTAFTSDCKSRWASLWITGWDGYGQFWSQVLRETARLPQGQALDVQVNDRAGRAEIQVDLLEDAGSFRNDASVEADVYFVPAGALGSNMELLHRVLLEQEGPGRYRAGFVPSEPGLYLVRARSGALLATAGLVHQPSGEAATGRLDDELAERVAEATGGSVLAADASALPPIAAGVASLLELRPLLLRLLLVLFIFDVAIRRWENLHGLVEGVREHFSRRTASATNSKN